MPVPQFLAAIRSASSYSIPPEHPPSGGIFYIINAHDPEEIHKEYHKEYQILSAHETWPGHHLLDISRWSLKSPVLRAVEQARTSARKYSLNPGYQLCYTVGLQKFIDLFQCYGKNNLKKFSRVVLNHGEIGFSDLEKILKQPGII